MHTMNETSFIPAEDSAELSKIATGVTIAAADLMRKMVDMLPDERRERFLVVLEEGGRVGVECTVDAKAGRQLTLVAISKDGARYEAAELLFLGEPPRSG